MSVWSGFGFFSKFFFDLVTFFDKNRTKLKMITPSHPNRNLIWLFSKRIPNQCWFNIFFKKNTKIIIFSIDTNYPVKKLRSWVWTGLTIVLKPDPARRVDPGLEPGRVEEKTGEEKTRCDPTTRLIRLQTCWLLFFFN